MGGQAANINLISLIGEIMLQQIILLVYLFCLALDPFYQLPVRIISMASSTEDS